MSVATATKTVPAATKATKATKAVALKGADLDRELVAIVKRWELAEAAESKALDVFKAAGIAWENTRVIKSRVAYAAAMLTPNQGQANLLAATRFLKLTEEERKLSATKVKALAVAKKNSIRNYVDAGIALNEAGFANSKAEPTEEERKIVAAAFRDGNKRDKEEKNAEKAENTENNGDNGGVEGSTPAEDEALTFATVLAHVARMNGTVDMLIKGSIPVTEADMDLFEKCISDIKVKLAMHAG